jgi:MFS family permease
MHDVHLEPTGNSNLPKANSLTWFKYMNRYQFFVLVVAALGWLFDTMDQQLFVLARAPAMRELVTVSEFNPEDPEYKVKVKAKQDFQGTLATTIFMLGWATGGLFFGMLGDKIGRAKTMLLTILIYSVCTGLSAFSVGVYDFAFYRFITGLGVGGEFAVGVSLVAEVMPDNIRTYALGLLQALSAVGNVIAALISLSLGELEHSGVIGEFEIFGVKLTAWRLMFVVGTIPALLAVSIRSSLKEPEKWQKSAGKEGTKKVAGSYKELFSNPVTRNNALFGMMLAVAGVIGVWGLGFFSPELLRAVMRPVIEKSMTEELQKTGIEAAEIQVKLAKAVPYELNTRVSIAMLTFNVGAFFGMYFFGIISSILGRKSSFAIMLVFAIASVWLVFGTLDEYHEIFWMMPLMGFCLMSIFGGYSIYFPELFPTHLRSTGTSFCYNVGRYVAAFGPSLLGMLIVFYTQADSEGMRKTIAGLFDALMIGQFASLDVSNPANAIRFAGITMSSVYLIGLLVLPFLPETKDRPLPE